MANKKTLLMRGDRYGLLKAAELAAELIGQYERGRDGASMIRVEVPDGESWDDIEVTHSGGVDRWQVKRLKEQLGADEVRTLLEAAAKGNGARHMLGVATFVPIKDGAKVLCNLLDLAELCSEAQKPGIDASMFAKREKNKPAFKLVLSSMKSGVADDVVLAVLQRLHVKALGLEDALRERARSHIEDIFTNVDEVVQELFSWFLKTPDAAVGVDIALLNKHVLEGRAVRDPARPRWIHLARDPVSATWAFRGPLAHQDLVEVAWSAGRVRVLVGAPPRAGEGTTAAVARLVLHRVATALVEASVADASDWSQQASSLCGGTLGKSGAPARFACDVLPVATPSHAPRAEADTPTFATHLHAAMELRVWSALISAIDKLLDETNLAQDLRPKMRARWAAWHAALDADPRRRASFLRSMLATVDEWGRKGFDASVRVGPELVDALARATVVALAMATAFEGGKMTIDIGATDAIDNLVLGEVHAHVIALSAASHPEDRKPYLLADAAGPMLASENAIAILAAVDASASDLFDVAREEMVPFHASDLASQSYRHTGSPPPILTANPRFIAALAKGVEALRKHLDDMLRRMNDVRLESLRKALNGAPNG